MPVRAQLTARRPRRHIWRRNETPWESWPARLASTNLMVGHQRPPLGLRCRRLPGWRRRRSAARRWLSQRSGWCSVIGSHPPEDGSMERPSGRRLTRSLSSFSIAIWKGERGIDRCSAWASCSASTRSRIEEYKPVHQEVWRRDPGDHRQGQHHKLLDLHLRQDPERAPPAGADRGARAQGGPARSDPARACPPAPSRGRCRSRDRSPVARGWCCSSPDISRRKVHRGLKSARV